MDQFKEGQNVSQEKTTKIIVKNDFNYVINNRSITFMAGEHDIDLNTAHWIGEQFHNVEFKKYDKKKKKK